MPKMNKLKIKLFADGANLDGMLSLYKDPNIKGFTTNPTLMKKAGITDYEKFAKQVLLEIPDRPVSFEVFAVDLDDSSGKNNCILGIKCKCENSSNKHQRGIYGTNN